MKQTIRVFAALFALLTLLCLCSCELPMPEEGEALEDLTEDVIEEILEGDSDAVRSYFSTDTDLTDFDAVFAEWQTLLADVRDFELMPVGWRKNIKGGIHSFELTCRVRCAVEGLMLRVTTVEGRLTGFTFYLEDPEVTGGGVLVANIALWTLTGLSVALMVFMVMDCAKRKLNAKPLWLILILLGHLKLYVSTLKGSFSGGFHIGNLVPYSELTAYESGVFDLRIILPVGALVYFFLRSRLTASYEKEQAEKKGATPTALESADPLPETPATPKEADTDGEDSFDVSQKPDADE